MKTSIIGAGHAGLALAKELSEDGHSVCLYAHQEHDKNLSAIQRNGNGINFKTFTDEGSVSVTKTTRSLKEAAEFANLLFMVVPSFAQMELFAELRNFLSEQHVVTIMPGNFGTILFLREYVQQKNLARPILVEANSVPQISRATEGSVFISRHKKPGMKFSYLTDEIKKQQTAALLDQLFSFPIHHCSHFLESGLSTINGIFHPLPALMNLSNVDNNPGGFYFYKTGMSPSICKLMEKLDEERIDIAKSFGIRSKTFLEIVNHHYDLEAKTLREFVSVSPSHNSGYHAPDCTKHRYFTEDGSSLLAAWLSLAKFNEVHTPLLESAVTLFTLINNVGENRKISPDDLFHCGQVTANKDEVTMQTEMASVHS